MTTTRLHFLPFTFFAAQMTSREFPLYENAIAMSDSLAEFAVWTAWSESKSYTHLKWSFVSFPIRFLGGQR